MVKTIRVSVSRDEVSKSKKEIRRGGHAWVVSDVIWLWLPRYHVRDRDRVSSRREISLLREKQYIGGGEAETEIKVWYPPNDELCDPL